SEVVASCARQGYAETAVVVDADGVRQSVLRGDRAGSHTLDSANDKAYTAASFKADTSVLVERAKTVPGFSALFTQLPHLRASCRNRQMGGLALHRSDFKQSGIVTWC
ncbi:MAG TPA: heme-binding protein, partial [Allosphingosinicella sp.]